MNSFLLGDYYSKEIRTRPLDFVFRVARYKHAKRLIANFKVNNILDIGCGDGLGASIMAAPGYSYHGVDICSNSIDIAVKNFQNRSSFIFEKTDYLLSDLPQTYEAVLCLGLLHMVKNEDDLLEKIFRNLTLGGVAIFTLPNFSAQNFANPSHASVNINMKDESNLRFLLEKYFSYVLIFGMNDEILHTGHYGMSHHLFALCIK